MYGSFLPVQSLSAAYSTGDKFARVCSLFEGVFDITSTCFHGENSVDQSGAGYIIPIPRSPWIYRGKPHLSLGLRPRDRVVFRDKSLVTVV